MPAFQNYKSSAPGPSLPPPEKWAWVTADYRTTFGNNWLYVPTYN